MAHHRAVAQAPKPTVSLPEDVRRSPSKHVFALAGFVQTPLSPSTWSGVSREKKNSQQLSKKAATGREEAMHFTFSFQMYEINASFLEGSSYLTYKIDRNDDDVTSQTITVVWCWPRRGSSLAQFSGFTFLIRASPLWIAGCFASVKQQRYIIQPCHVEPPRSTGRGTHSSAGAIRL